MEAVLCIAVLCAVFGKGAAELCYTGFLETKYCSYGCCGSSYNQYCCSYFNYPLYIGLGVTGGIIFLVCLIGFLIYLCNRHSRPGRVINANPNTGPAIATVTHYNTANGFVQANTTMYPPAPMYTQQMAAYPQPPSYSGATFSTPQGGALPPGYTPADSKPPVY